MIPQDAISEIFESARVEEVIQDYVTLKKRGVNMIGNCPFHNEKTPSFTVSPTKGIYKCFGCGKAGNSVNFMMEHEQMTYPEALRYLANKYNIEIEEKELSPEQKEQQSSRESLQIVNSYAQKYFTQQLLETDEGKSIGLSYFKERGYSMETIERFQLGYNPDVWNGFTSEALKQGYKEEFLLASGLTKGEPGKRFDFFKGRVMFPIHTITGRVIAFGGRTLRNDKKTAKYFNSPESELYNKSKVLYGLYFAKKDIVKKDVCYLVEGYTDVISLHQRGIENVVSSSGTSLTVEQIKLIKRYTPNITMLFDGDVAGIKASFRGIDMILKELYKYKGKNGTYLYRNLMVENIKLIDPAVDTAKELHEYLKNESLFNPSGNIKNSEFYISVTNVDYSEKDQSVQIISRFFIDDMNAVIKERYGVPSKLGTDRESAIDREYLEKYIRAKFLVEINGEFEEMSFNVDTSKSFKELESLFKEVNINNGIYSVF